MLVDDEMVGPINTVKVSNSIIYHEQMSQLKTNKGKPMKDQVTPFAQMKN